MTYTARPRDLRAVALLTVLLGASTAAMTGCGDETSGAGAGSAMPLRTCHHRFAGLVEIMGEDGTETSRAVPRLAADVRALHRGARTLATTDDRDECSRQWPRYDRAYNHTLWNDEVRVVDTYDMVDELARSERDLAHARRTRPGFRLKSQLKSAFVDLRHNAAPATDDVRPELDALVATDIFDSSAMKAAADDVRQAAGESERMVACQHDLDVIAEDELDEE